MINLYGSRAGTQFTFDKIYPNRYEMDQNCENDGVFIGRYVLVSYEQKKPQGNYFDIYQEDTVVNDISDNLAKDISIYGAEENNKLWNGVGWDNTVWQKQYIDNVYVYVKIADLNSFNFNTIDGGNSNFTNDYIKYQNHYSQNLIPITVNYWYTTPGQSEGQIKHTFTIYVNDNICYQPIVIPGHILYTTESGNKELYRVLENGITGSFFNQVQASGSFSDDSRSLIYIKYFSKIPENEPPLIIHINLEYLGGVTQ